MRTFISVPSRDLIASTGPSTASMVPRIRTVGAGCAQAMEANSEAVSSEAAKTRVIGEAIRGMAIPSQGRFADQSRRNTGRAELFRCMAFPSPLVGEGGTDEVRAG